MTSPTAPARPTADGTADGPQPAVALPAIDADPTVAPRSAAPATPAPTLRARTVRIADPGPLLAQLPAGLSAREVCTWVRDCEGIVGWGRAAAVQTHGARRYADAQDWWRRCVERAEVEDDVELAGTGPVAFGSFSYSAGSPEGACLVVPRVVLGHRQGTWWRTTIETTETTDAPPAPDAAAHSEAIPSETMSSHSMPSDSMDGADSPRGHGEVAFSDGSLSGAQWRDVVARAVTRIADGHLDKVVLARDVIGRAQAPIDPRLLAQRLAASYGRTWVFCVDGLVGATPEMLVRLERGLVTSRVLAGTIRRTGDDEHDLALAASLARSSKDLEEHEYAVRSVADALAEHCTSMNVPESPFVLHLPNVMHLATDVAGRMRNGGTSLGLAASLHPSAAVCGTPTATADALIDELEGMDRGRYAGPVGWIGASGDGEWGIALRSGALDPADERQIRIYAGCGIVAGSDPDAELAESEAKLVPMRGALAG